MAREDTTPEQIESLAALLSGISTSIAGIAAQLKQNKVPTARLHLGTLTNVLIPQIEHWLDVAQSNANEDVRSFLRGIEPRSKIQKRYDQNRKRAAAKKPAKKVSKRRVCAALRMQQGTRCEEPPLRGFAPDYWRLVKRI